MSLYATIAALAVTGDLIPVTVSAVSERNLAWTAVSIDAYVTRAVASYDDAGAERRTRRTLYVAGVDPAEWTGVELVIGGTPVRFYVRGWRMVDGVNVLDIERVVEYGG